MLFSPFVGPPSLIDKQAPFVIDFEKNWAWKNGGISKEWEAKGGMDKRCFAEEGLIEPSPTNLP